jgi:hypothetical protein
LPDPLRILVPKWIRPVESLARVAEAVGRNAPAVRIHCHWIPSLVVGIILTRIGQGPGNNPGVEEVLERMKMTRWIGIAVVAACSLSPAGALAAGKTGDVIQTDTLGMNFVTYAFDTKKTTTVADATVLSEFTGAHYYFIDGLRAGMNLQFSEQLRPTVTTGSTFRTFALLPQLGWDFWGPMFAGLVVTVAPWTSGTPTFDFGLQALLGAGIPVSSRVKIAGLIEVPANFVVHRTIGFTTLLGVSIRLSGDPPPPPASLPPPASPPPSP